MTFRERPIPTVLTSNEHTCRKFKSGTVGSGIFINHEILPTHLIKLTIYHSKPNSLLILVLKKKEAISWRSAPKEMFEIIFLEKY